MTKTTTDSRVPRTSSVSAALLACAGMAVCVSTALAVQPAAPQPPTPPAAAAAGEAAPDAPTLNPALAPFQGRVIRQVTVIGLKTVDETLVRNQIRAAMGEPLDESVVREDIQRLNRLGRFRDISARVQPYDDRSVELIYEMGETPIIVDVQAVGNRQISDQELAGEVNILAGTPVDRFQIDRTLRRIKELYLKKGYYQADVQIEEETLEKQGILVFRIREGERLRVTDLRFSGNAAFPAGRLRPNVKTKTWGIFNSGALDDTVLDQDVAALIQFYKDRGYLDVRIDRIIRPSPDAREAIITFIIEEGPVYTLRTVRAELDEAGALSGKPPTVFTPEQIAGLMSIKAGDVYSLDKIRKSVDAVRQSYEQLGYVDIQIQRIEVREPDQPRVDLLLAIREGRQFNTGAVIIKGNELTQQKVVRREVRLEPDRPLDATELTRAQERLEQSRIFDPREIRITIQPEDPANPGTRDVLTQIKETNTASLSFGAAVNSDAGVIGTIELRQRNFDLFDTPDSLDELLRFRAFRGAGQQFSILAQPGTETQNYSISLGEPSLFDTDYSGSIGGGFRSREFDDYLEERLGANTAIGRRFGDRWAGSLTLRGDRVTVSDVTADIVELQAQRGTNTITGAGLRLRRTDLDKSIRPTQGSVVDFGVERVGALGGTYSFTKLSAAGQLFVPLYEDFNALRTVLQFRSSVDYIPEGEGEVPVSERIYLGGRDLRGFAFRGVGPNGRRTNGTINDGIVVGGTYGFFLGTQIEQPIVGENLAAVAFVDSGTVRNDPGFGEYRVSAGVGLRIYLAALGPAPLAFDFAFPLSQQKGDEERVFSFALDLPL